MLNYSLCDILFVLFLPQWGEGQVNSDTICSIRLHRLKGSIHLTTLSLDLALLQESPGHLHYWATGYKFQGSHYPHRFETLLEKSQNSSATLITEVLLKRRYIGHAREELTHMCPSLSGVRYVTLLAYKRVPQPEISTELWCPLFWSGLATTILISVFLIALNLA